MRITDAHIHFSNIASFKQCAISTSNVDYSEAGFAKETAENNIVRAICMGLTENAAGGFPDKNTQTPMLADLTEQRPPAIYLCLGINPHTLNEQSIAKMESIIKSEKNIVGMKIYAGYYHFDVCDKIFAPAYNLAEKYDLTVVVHSGNTYSEEALLEFAHPLKIDRLAVQRRDTRIVICHMGSPWVYDACEVAYKNKNVYLDTSGLLEGNATYIDNMAAKQLFVDRFKSALIFLDNYNKVMFGTDWPLVPMNAYVELCKKIVPPETYEKVFWENAASVFKLP
ncbi:MAG: amidohydrolase [Spirochaetes bacterium]|nr:amidohydrolase [Spirochaetota bacterium]